MAKKVQEIDVPTGTEEAFETNTEALKVQNRMALDRLAILNDTILQVVSGMNNLKQAYFTMDNKIDTVLARLDSIGTLTAQVAPTPAPVVLPIEPMQPPQQPAVQPAPIQGGAGGQTTFEKKTPAVRLTMDGAGERGKAPLTNSKGNINQFEALTVTPLECTEKSFKVVFPGSWSEKFQSSEVFLPKSLISPDSVIMRNKGVPQTINVVNWWIKQNSR